MISFKKFDMDRTIVAPTIFLKHGVPMPHWTTDIGVVLEPEVRKELRRFFRAFNRLNGWSGDHCYYRVDAYFTPNQITVLEINVEFVDGWGTGLNLSRAAGIEVNPTLLTFPRRFMTTHTAYLPELELCVNELKLKGKEAEVVADGFGYVYRRSRDSEKFHREDGGAGEWMDDKCYLAEFSREWKSNLVQTPRHYFHGHHPHNSSWAI